MPVLRPAELITWQQETHCGRYTELSFGDPDWEQLASAFGWNGHYVSRSEDFAAALEFAFQESGPSFAGSIAPTSQ